MTQNSPTDDGDGGTYHVVELPAEEYNGNVPSLHGTYSKREIAYQKVKELVSEDFWADYQIIGEGEGIPVGVEVLGFNKKMWLSVCVDCHAVFLTDRDDRARCQKCDPAMEENHQ